MAFMRWLDNREATWERLLSLSVARRPLATGVVLGSIAGVMQVGAQWPLEATRDVLWVLFWVAALFVVGLVLGRKVRQWQGDLEARDEP